MRADTAVPLSLFSVTGAVMLVSLPLAVIVEAEVSVLTLFAGGEVGGEVIMGSSLVLIA